MKWGLGESYDKVSILPVKLRAWIDLTKPASSVGAFGAAVLASIVYFLYVEGGGIVWILAEKHISIIYVGVTMWLAHSASQVMNMAEDAEMDKQTEHKKNRPIPSGVVSEDEARTIAWILAAAAFGRAYLFNFSFGVFTTVLIFLGIFYNLSPIRAKERIISIPWQAVSRGLLPFPAIWAAFGNPFSIFPWVMGVFMFFYVLGFQNSADIMDRHIDEEYGIKTFIVVFGVKRTVIIAFWCTMAMAGAIIFSVWLNLIEEIFYLMLTFIPYCLWMCLKLWSDPYEVHEKTGNHPTWLMFYAGLVMILLTLTVIEMVHG